ncbi:MAG: 3'(2'),5'-bisphosphate nucleotidase CysQ [Paracoccaceae bacterium]|nr:3'(2'),5'-bisphosphate nucleotidase CysQ [Paracoccaceae bacterium]MDG2258165.1 3'(2'),5'-bisphosphate nucleotidase CysQ [Paracoccaceae bacterium]
MQETHDLDLLIKAAEAAGDIATGFFRGKNQVWDKPEGAGPVTEADLAVDTMLRDTLCAARPDYGWLSEETDDDPSRLDKDKVFIIDPIDGTRSFVAGSSTWAHSLAIAERGKVTAAVVFLPIRGKIYAASTGGGSTLNGSMMQPDWNAPETGATVLAARPIMDEKNWPGGVPDIDRQYRPSLAYRLCLVAEGRFNAMLTLRKSWEWDIAAGELILAEAGAAVTDQVGEALKFNNPLPKTNGVIAAGHVLHTDLLKRLNAGQGH